MISKIVTSILFASLIISQLTVLTLVAKAAENDTAVVLCEQKVKGQAPTYDVVLAEVAGNCLNSISLPAEGQCDVDSPCVTCLQSLHNVLLEIETSDQVSNNRVVYVLRATNEVGCQR